MELVCMYDKFIMITRIIIISPAMNTIIVLPVCF